MNIALIAAAGESKRMDGKIPKLLMPIHNKPLLYFTVANFYDNPNINRIVIVVNRKMKKAVEKMIKAYFPGNSKGIKLVPGGLMRSESVLNGIQYIKRYLKPKSKDLILIHNGANPIVTDDELEKCIKKAEAKGACILSHPIKETLKEANKHRVVKSHDRLKFRLAQTPQVFQFGVLRDSLEKVGVDYLGVSLDALLIYCSENASKKIIEDLKKIHIKCNEIGYVDDSNQVSIIFKDEGKKDILPRFRESAYNKIKQEIGEDTPKSLEKMEKDIENAALEALKKRSKIIESIRESNVINHK